MVIKTCFKQGCGSGSDGSGTFQVEAEAAAEAIKFFQVEAEAVDVEAEAIVVEAEAMDVNFPLQKPFSLTHIFQKCQENFLKGAFGVNSTIS